MSSQKGPPRGWGWSSYRSLPGMGREFSDGHNIGTDLSGWQGSDTCSLTGELGAPQLDT